MNKSTITINVELDADKIPSAISWNASDTTAENPQKAKAMMLSFWDAGDKAALRMDLWTRDMMVDEMGDFFYQTLMTMADTYGRATRQEELVSEMKEFARQLYQKIKKQDLQQNKAL